MHNGFTICLIYSDKLMYTTQCEINVELPNLWYTVVLLPQKRFFEWFWVSAVHRPVPSFIGRTVNGKLKILQIRSKNRFWGKRTTIYYRLANLTLIYIAIGQANGKSNTFTIKWQSITHTDFVGLLCTPTKNETLYYTHYSGWIIYFMSLKLIFKNIL